jgi:hypothetical protein
VGVLDEINIYVEKKERKGRKEEGGKEGREGGREGGRKG